MKVSKRFPLAFIYFFINSLGLPTGLLYTTLLTPFLYVWILIKTKKEILSKFFILLLPFILIQFINGVDTFSYVKSLFLFASVYVFSYAFVIHIKSNTGIEKLFQNLLSINFILVLFSLVVLFTPFKHWLWLDWSISAYGIYVDNLQRLKMFTYEPSYYSTLFVPIFSFYFIKFILKQIDKGVVTILLMATVPLILSFSLGVLSSLVFSILILFSLNIFKVLSNRKLFYSFVSLAISFFLITLYLFIFYRDNPLFVRILAINSGNDLSASGRTFEAYELAYKIAGEKSIWWGVGPGQLKIVGDPIIKEFYMYRSDYGQVSIPNAVAETLTLFGFMGVGIRLFIEMYLFFKAKVLNNYFQTMLFFFIFIYQFTGSFTTNIAEYVIWILAFTNIFPQFNKQPGEFTKAEI